MMGLPPTASSIGAGGDSSGIPVDPVVDVGSTGGATSGVSDGLYSLNPISGVDGPIGGVTGVSTGTLNRCHWIISFCINFFCIKVEQICI